MNNSWIHHFLSFRVYYCFLCWRLPPNYAKRTCVSPHRSYRCWVNSRVPGATVDDIVRSAPLGTQGHECCKTTFQCRWNQSGERPIVNGGRRVGRDGASSKTTRGLFVFFLPSSVVRWKESKGRFAMNSWFRWEVMASTLCRHFAIDEVLYRCIHWFLVESSTLLRRSQ